MNPQSKKPRVFISSTISELNDERLIVKECVEMFGFEPIMFEEWGARTSGVRQTYIDEVMNSDLYVGIFYENYSAPTIEEYETAKAHNKDIMIYVKNLTKGRKENKLQSFIESISEPNKGHVICYFNNIMELKRKVKLDISYWIGGFVSSKTRKDLEKYRMTEIILALDSLVANKILMLTGDKYFIDPDFRDEFVNNFAEKLAKIFEKKRPYDSKIVLICLNEVMIKTLLKRMGSIHESVLSIYMDIIESFIYGEKLNNFLDNVENFVNRTYLK